MEIPAQHYSKSNRQLHQPGPSTWTQPTLWINQTSHPVTTPSYGSVRSKPMGHLSPSHPSVAALCSSTSPPRRVNHHHCSSSSSPTDNYSTDRRPSYIISSRPHICHHGTHAKSPISGTTLGLIQGRNIFLLVRRQLLLLHRTMVQSLPRLHRHPPQAIQRPLQVTTSSSPVLCHSLIV